MTVHNGLVQPVTLVEGLEYLRQEKPGAGEQGDPVPVIFITYHSCPAFVIVGSGQRKVRCLRDELFVLHND